MASQPSGRTGAPPSVLLVSTDHWPAYLMAGAGHRAVRTPTLDSLAGAGRALYKRLCRMPGLHAGPPHADDRHDAPHARRP